MSNLRPILARVQEPIFLLVPLRKGAEKWYIDDVEIFWVGSVLILSLVLRDFLILPAAHWPDPLRWPTFYEFFARDTPTVQLPGVGQANDALDG
jgi:hypothetical protein